MDIFEKAGIAYNQAFDGINIKENEKIVLECKSPTYSFYFARYIPGANIENHFKVIFNSGNKFWLNRFIKEVNYKGTKVEEWLLYI